MKFLLTSLFSLLFCITLSAYGAEYKFTSEDELEKLYDSTISPAFYKKKLHYFQTRDALKIAYKIFDVRDAKANIVISSGRTESMVKYQELIYDLNRNGYSVYILDHRGQGYSQRVTEDTQMGHVNNFFNYVLDLREFVSLIVPKDRELILLGHSMGGAIASLYVQSYPKDFDLLILSSPMHQPIVLNSFLSDFACRFLVKTGINFESYVPGGKSYDKSQHKFKNNPFTHSKSRYEVVKTAYEKESSTKIGAPSVGWLYEACMWSEKSVDMARKIEIPVLLLQASEDKIVNASAQEEFCENVSGGCELVIIKGANHEMFIERDSLRKEVLNSLLDFISKT